MSLVARRTRGSRSRDTGKDPGPSTCPPNASAFEASYVSVECAPPPSPATNRGVDDFWSVGLVKELIASVRRGLAEQKRLDELIGSCPGGPPKLLVEPELLAHLR